MKTRIKTKLPLVLLGFILSMSQMIVAQTCPDPSGLGVQNLQNTSATLLWQGTSTSYKIWFGPQGFYQGSLTTGGIQYNSSTNSIALNTLLSNLCYEYVVKGYCAPNDSSSWVGPYQFCTANCPSFTAPYSQNFDGTSTPNIDLCWDDNTTVANSAVRTSTSQSTSSPNSAELYYSTGSGAVLLISPMFSDFDNQKRIRFNVWDDDGTSDLVVGTMSNPLDSTTFTPYQTITAAEMPDDQWKEIRVLFDNYTGTDNYVAFSHGQNADYDNFYIDDFIYEEPTCLDPSGLTYNSNTLTSVDISWQTGGATNWDVEYGSLGYIPGTGTQVSSSSNTNFILSSLSQGAVYDVYVRDNCGAGDVGLWIGPLVVYTSTACTPLSGTYTIGATGNYTTFTDAANALAVCGVSGPVTFNIQSGYYSGKLHLQGIPGVRKGIPGISAVNTVTFNGSGSDTLEWDNSGVQTTVWIDSVSHVTLNDMYIINDVLVEGWGILITGNSDSIHLTNNTIYMDSSGVYHRDKSPIVVSGNVFNDNSSGARADYLRITGNTLYGGYYGMSIYGGGSSRSDFSANLLIQNNEIRNYYYGGLYINYYDGVEIRANRIESTNSATDEDGMYFLNSDNYVIEENYIHVKDRGIYLNDGNDGASVTQNSMVVNNMVISENDYGLYFNDLESTNVFHNSVVGEPALRINDQVNINVQNNILNAQGDYAFESDDDLAVSDTVDYNLYYVTGTSDAFDIGSSGKLSNLAAWQLADPTQNLNSVEGDPLFFSSDDLHVLGNLANNAGNNNLGIFVDIDGDARPISGSTIVDIGADEYSLLNGDVALHSATFEKKIFCLSSSDTIMFLVENIIGGASDLSLAPLTAHYAVTGPVNTSGTITVNTGMLGANDTLEMRAFNIDLSIPGTYTLNGYIDPTVDNALGFNDTLVLNSVKIIVDTVFRVTPKSVTLAGRDTASLKAISPFFAGGDLFITEITQFSSAGTTGGPAGGKPAYIVADDYIEITGVPGANIQGYTLEQWEGVGFISTYTFASGTVLSPNGTAIIAVGTLGASVEDPSNFYYHGNGSYTGTWGSGRPTGRLIKDPNGNIIDAVAYQSYAWHAASGVTAADWSGSLPSGSSSFGLRLEGPDLNDQTGWVASATSPQDPNVINSGVVVPTISTVGFSWSVGGNQLGTDLSIDVYGDSLLAGIYNYVATYNTSCGIYKDTVVVTRLACIAPVVPTVMSMGCDSAVIALGNVGDSLLVQYGASGFSLGSGTFGNVPIGNTSYSINGLTSGNTYEVYVANICANGDTSVFMGPLTITPMATLTKASFTYTLNGFVVNFDGTGSTGSSALTYVWDYGDGNFGSGATPVHTYTSGGGYSITLTVSDVCGADDTIMVIANVDLLENLLNTSLSIYPNPSKDEININFSANGNAEATIQVLEMGGKEVLQAKQPSLNGVYAGTLNLSQLPQGVYTLVINCGDQKAVRRLIKI